MFGVIKHLLVQFGHEQTGTFCENEEETCNFKHPQVILCNGYEPWRIWSSVGEHIASCTTDTPLFSVLYHYKHLTIVLDSLTTIMSYLHADTCNRWQSDAGLSVHVRQCTQCRGISTHQCCVDVIVLRGFNGVMFLAVIATWRRCCYYRDSYSLLSGYLNRYLCVCACARVCVCVYGCVCVCENNIFGIRCKSIPLCLSIGLILNNCPYKTMPYVNTRTGNVLLTSHWLVYGNDAENYTIIVGFSYLSHVSKLVAIHV